MHAYAHALRDHGQPHPLRYNNISSHGIGSLQLIKMSCDAIWDYSAMLGAGLIFFMGDLLEIGTDGLHF